MKTTVTTCGTSILTHECSKEERDFLNASANKREADYAPEDRERLLKIVEANRTALLAASEDEARKMSEELNGFIGCYRRNGGRLSDAGNDVHFLIHTDTLQGRLAAEILQDWGTSQGFGISPIRIEDLNTASLDEFRLGIGNLIQWCWETLPGYRSSGYEIIFNLVGGFKSLQGYMQTLGMLYAHETVYIFETGGELLSIPQIPLDLEAKAKQTVLDHFETFRKMQQGDIPMEECAGIPETMLRISDGHCTLSEWGKIIWGEVREARYREELLPPLSPLLSYSDRMRADALQFQNDGPRMLKLNQALDRLSRYLDAGRQKNLNSCDYKKLIGKPVPGSTHEFDLWPDRRGWRGFCHEEDGKVIVDSIGEGLKHK